MCKVLILCGSLFLVFTKAKIEENAERCRLVWNIIFDDQKNDRVLFKFKDLFKKRTRLFEKLLNNFLIVVGNNIY